MADREVLQHPGDFLLDGVLIVGSSGVEVEVKELLKELNMGFFYCFSKETTSTSCQITI